MRRVIPSGDVMDEMIHAVEANVVPGAVVVTFADGKVAVLRTAEIYWFALSPNSIATERIADFD